MPGITITSLAELFCKLQFCDTTFYKEETGVELLKFLDPDPEADDFQNLINSSLSIDTSVVTFT